MFYLSLSEEVACKIRSKKPHHSFMQSNLNIVKIRMKALKGVGVVQSNFSCLSTMNLEMTPQLSFPLLPLLLSLCVQAPKLEILLESRESSPLKLYSILKKG